MHIRLAQTSDIPAILEISNWAAINTPANFAVEPETLESWQQSFDQTHKKFPWLVAELTAGARNVIGFAKASPHKSRCAYAWSAEVSVYVSPDYHGKCVGTTLYGRLLPTLKEQGFITLIAGITLPNAASERLHAAFGFKQVGTFFKVGWKFDRWHDVAYYELFLRDGIAAPGTIRSMKEVWKE
jgi:phosphinothricin acetyltransferase